MMFHVATTNPPSRHLRPASLLLAGLLLLGLTGYAHADCNTLNYHTGTVSFPSATIMLPNQINAGQVLGTLPSTPVVNPLSGSCSGSTGNGLQNQLAGAANSSDDTLFPTGIDGLSYRILFTGNNNFTNAPSGIHAYPHQASDTGNITFSGNAQLQLVVTNPAAFAATNSPHISGPVARWGVDGCFWFLFCGTGYAVNFKAAGISFSTPACSVVGNGDLTVPLPVAYASAFTHVDSTAGQTPFHIQLNCASSGTKVFVTLAASSQPAGFNPDTGVIANTANNDSAGGIGVQILKANGTTSVTFGTAFNTGTTTSSSSYTIDLFARYYQTGATVTAGNVKAVATYTLNYQ